MLVAVCGLASSAAAGPLLGCRVADRWASCCGVDPNAAAGLLVLLAGGRFLGARTAAWWQDIEARRVTRFPGRPGSLASPGRSAGPRLLMRGVWLIELPAS